ncbi:MAG: helix-hairpin-helix domain-containing protein [Chlorobium sp.]|nr:MAG: helix-hairpin-helix domain-containing protein [Chlorobium sp.]
MSALEKTARALSLTKAEITLVTILISFLVLGGILKNIRSIEKEAVLVRKAEQSRFREAEVDSLIKLAAADQQHVKEEVLQDAAAEENGRPAARQREAHASEKVFTGTIAFNKAGKSQLEKIPGIGPVMAGRLIAFRKEKGGRVEQFQDFLEVKGIGKKKLELLKKHFTLE